MDDVVDDTDLHLGREAAGRLRSPGPAGIGRAGRGRLGAIGASAHGLEADVTDQHVRGEVVARRADERREVGDGQRGRLQVLPDARVADRVPAALGPESEQELEVLLETDVVARLRLVTKRMQEAAAFNEMRNKINDEVRKGIGKNQREAILREQMRAIKKELGEDGKGDDLDALKKKLNEAGLPEKVKEVVDRELRDQRAAGDGHASRGALS